MMAVMVQTMMKQTITGAKTTAGNTTAIHSTAHVDISFSFVLLQLSF